MWYDQYPGVPKRNSPLETLFILVHVARRDAEFLATSAQVRMQLALVTKKPETAQKAIEAFQNYTDAMLPFLENATNTTTTDHHRLMEHIKRPMEINMQSI